MPQTKSRQKLNIGKLINYVLKCTITKKKLNKNHFQAILSFRNNAIFDHVIHTYIEVIQSKVPVIFIEMNNKGFAIVFFNLRFNATVSDPNCN